MKRLRGKDTQFRDAEEETETKKDRDSVRLINRVNETQRDLYSELKKTQREKETERERDRGRKSQSDRETGKQRHTRQRCRWREKKQKYKDSVMLINRLTDRGSYKNLKRKAEGWIKKQKHRYVQIENREDKGIVLPKNSETKPR